VLVVPLGLTMAAVATACRTGPTQDQPAAAPQVSQAPAKLFLMVDMVQGSKNVPQDQAASKSCVLNSRFPRNAEIVWRARIFDAKSGDAAGSDAIARAEVRLANAVVVPMRYGPHPANAPNAESFWTGSWVVPMDQPTGTLRYSVAATAVDGRTGTFEPFSTAPSLLTIIDEAL
jgi:hypothetical protein